MKETIWNKQYDTDAATLVAASNNRTIEPEHASRRRETLYQDVSGEYFLHVERGPLPPERVKRENKDTPPEQLIPISDFEAYEWCHEKEQAAALKNHFCPCCGRSLRSAFDEHEENEADSE